MVTLCHTFLTSKTVCILPKWNNESFTDFAHQIFKTLMVQVKMIWWTRGEGSSLKHLGWFVPLRSLKDVWSFRREYPVTNSYKGFFFKTTLSNTNEVPQLLKLVLKKVREWILQKPSKNVTKSHEKDTLDFSVRYSSKCRSILFVLVQLKIWSFVGWYFMQSLREGKTAKKLCTSPVVVLQLSVYFSINRKLRGIFGGMIGISSSFKLQIDKSWKESTECPARFRSWLGDEVLCNGSSLTLHM